LHLMRVCASHNPDLPCIQGVHPHPTPRNRPVFPVRRKRTRSSYVVQMGQTHAKRPPLFARNEQPWRGPADAEARDAGPRGEGYAGYGAQGTRGAGAAGPTDAGRGTPGAGDAGVRDAGRGGRGGSGRGDARTPGKANAPLALWGSLPPSQANGAIWPGRLVADTTPRQGVARLGALHPGAPAVRRTRELRCAGVLVCRLVLRDDVRRNAPALIDLVSALLRPLPDLSTALAAGASARPAAPGRSARFARVLHIVG
jgi:hypothetical protein